MSNSNTHLQTQSSNALHNAIMEAGSKIVPPFYQNPPYIYQWLEKKHFQLLQEVIDTNHSKRYMENYKNVSQDIRDQMNAEAEANLETKFILGVGNSASRDGGITRIVLLHGFTDDDEMSEISSLELQDVSYQSFMNSETSPE
ncbi:hypothetical protein Tco_1096314 [Tanacetum coccineum]